MPMPTYDAYLCQFLPIMPTYAHEKPFLSRLQLPRGVGQIEIEWNTGVGLTLTEDMDLVERLQSLLLDADLNASNYGDIVITPSL